MAKITPYQVPARVASKKFFRDKNMELQIKTGEFSAIRLRDGHSSPSANVCIHDVFVGEQFILEVTE